MPIAEVRFYVAKCDGCGGERDLDGGEYQLTPENAEKIALEKTGFEDWAKTAAGRMLCLDCQAVQEVTDG